MEEKAVDEKATSRRSRKDEEGRDFQCGCGKRYLSYPALYTHIKTKHDGRQPEGTLKTGATQLTKRGKGKLEEELLRSVCGWMQRDELRLLTELEEASGTVPMVSRMRKEALPRETYESYQALLKEKEVRLSPSSSLDLALAVYLLNLGFHLNDKIYEQALTFARAARACFHEYGEEMYRGYFSRGEQGGPFVLGGFSSGEVRYFPIVADFFLQCYSPQSDARDLNPSLLQLLLFDFTNWLHTRRLTPIRPALPRDYRLDYRLNKHTRTPKHELPPDHPSEKDHPENDDSEELSENERPEPHDPHDPQEHNNDNHPEVEDRKEKEASEVD